MENEEVKATPEIEIVQPETVESTEAYSHGSGVHREDVQVEEVIL